MCALIAWFVGESKGYFLLGIWMSLVWAGGWCNSLSNTCERTVKP
jgi:hypothetical protein